MIFVGRDALGALGRRALRTAEIYRAVQAGLLRRRYGASASVKPLAQAEIYDRFKYNVQNG